MYDQAAEIKRLIDESRKILIIQADNPDADSLGSALALEEILGALSKEPYLYCGVDIPTYLRYMPGWDRVNKDLPSDFDLSIVVDCSTITLLEKLSESNQVGKLGTKPCIVIDHHEIVENTIPFETIKINDPSKTSAGEVIYHLAKQLDLSLSIPALEFILNSILGDTQGLSNKLAKPSTYRIIADMLEAGVDRAALEEKRRDYNKMPEQIYRYKGELIAKSKFLEENIIAYVVINQEEINKYSPLYNPAPLIQSDMLLTEGVLLAIVFKVYASAKLTASIRSNQSAPMANILAEKFGGGGHSFASGFKIDNALDPNKVIIDCLNQARELLISYKNENI